MTIEDLKISIWCETIEKRLRKENVTKPDADILRSIGLRLKSDTALIKQLGEALQDLWIRRGTVNGKEHDAVTAFNNWKRESGE